MEAVGLASGVAGLVSLAIALSKAIHSYVSAVKNRTTLLAELSHEITMLASALQDFDEFMKKSESEALRFHESSVLKLACKECEQRISKLADIFLESKSGEKGRHFWSRAKVIWPFQQKEVIQMVENLRRFTQIFHFAVTVKGCEMLAKSSVQVSGQLTELLEVAKQSREHALDNSTRATEAWSQLLEIARQSRKGVQDTSTQLQEILDLVPSLAQQASNLREINQTLQQAEERDLHERKEKILDWLASANSLHKHAEVQNRHVPGTGRWFLRDESFLSWAKGFGISPDFLCVGGPGTGKTMLCAIVIDHLRKMYADSDTAIVHYYCDFSEQKMQTPSHFARCVLRQLVQSSPSLPSVVSDFYQKTANDLPDAMWLKRLLNVITRVLNTFKQCFLVIDAIDETEAKYSRANFFDIINEMRGLGAQNKVRLFATTRPHTLNVEQQFPTTIPYEFSANMEDLYEFLKARIDKHPNSQETLDAELRNEIISELCENARGMFLLPALQIDQILDQVTKGDVKRALRDTSRSLPEVFRSTMERIQKSAPAKKNLAFKVLLWISYARRPLTISELQHAIAIRLDETDFNYDDVPSVNTLVESCCGLVELLDDNIFDNEDRYIRFVHLSLYEFLQHESHGMFNDAHPTIAKTCLKYLGFPSLRFAAQGNRKSLLTTISEFPFLEYASLYWGYHAQDLEVASYYALVSAVFTDRDALYLALRVRDARNPDNRNWQKMTMALLDSGSGGIAVAASFGLAKLTEALINDNAAPNLDVQNIYGSTPLHECAINGSIETADILIRHGANVLSPNKGGATPFYLAVSFDKIKMCQLLLQHGKEQLDVPRSDGSTALHKAADVGSDEMVSFLIQAGAKLDTFNNAERGGRMTPLHLACRRGYLVTARLLVEAGADLALRSKDGCTALDLAATGGFMDLCEYLVLQGSRVRDVYQGGWTPLHRAARAGHTDVVKFLLDRGARLFATDPVGNIPLTLAVKNGNLECTQAILGHDPALMLRQLLHREKRGESTAIVAFYTSHYELYKYLRELENKLLSRDSAGAQTKLDPTLPMIHAIEKGALDDVVRLLDVQPDLLTQLDTLGQTALHTAFLEEQRDIAVALLERDVDINIRGFHGWTPLHIAAAQGSYRMLCLALQYEADVNVVSDTRQTSLHKAASSHSMDVIIELLQCGCDPRARNNKGMTPLHVAAHQNFVGAVRELLNPRWRQQTPKDATTKDTTPLALIEDRRKATARWWAEKGGHLELAAYLRIEEKRAKSEMAAGKTGGSGGGSSSKTSSSKSSPNLSRSSTGFDMLTRSMTMATRTSTNSSQSTRTISRTTTQEGLSRRNTSGASSSFLSLPSPSPIGGARRGPAAAGVGVHHHHQYHTSRQSTDSLFSALEDEDGPWSEGSPSPVRTPTFHHSNSSPMSYGNHTPTSPMLRDDSVIRHERRLAEMLLEIDSD